MIWGDFEDYSKFQFLDDYFKETLEKLIITFENSLKRILSKLKEKSENLKVNDNEVEGIFSTFTPISGATGYVIE